MTRLRCGVALLALAAVIAGIDGLMGGPRAIVRQLAVAERAYPVAYYPVTVSRIVDGDTIHGRIDLGWDIHLGWTVIRANGYDAWETSRRRSSLRLTDEEWKEEIAKGRAAEAALRELLGSGPVYIRKPIGKQRDVYGRVLGGLYVMQAGRMVTVSSRMRAEGHDRGD